MSLDSDICTVEARSADADHGERRAIQPYAQADDLTFACETFLPEVVLQHRHRMSQSSSVVILRQEAAKERLNTEDIEIVAGYHSHPDQLTAVIADQACILDNLAGEP